MRNRVATRPAEWPTSLAEVLNPRVNRPAIWVRCACAKHLRGHLLPRHLDN